MNITEIEGLPYSELRERHDELVAACKDMKPDVLAARYVQARTDAAMRDGKLGDQAKTIEALQSGLKAAEAHVEASKKAAQEQTAIVAETQAKLDTAITESTKLTGQVATLKGECRTATELAKARRTALADVMNHANSLTAKVAPLLATEG